MSANKLPDHSSLLGWVLWKLQGTQPLTIDLPDVQACHQAFQPGGPALLVRAVNTGVELRVTTHEDARMRREFEDSRVGHD